MVCTYKFHVPSLGCSVYLSVCLFVTTVYCGKTADSIEMPFGSCLPKEPCVIWSPDPPMGRDILRKGGKWATKCNVYGECGFRRAKTAEPNEPLSRIVSNEGSRNRVLRSTCNWRHLANTVERLCFAAVSALSVSYTHLTLPTILRV